jgi:hypothetical protein
MAVSSYSDSEDFPAMCDAIEPVSNEGSQTESSVVTEKPATTKARGDSRPFPRLSGSGSELAHVVGFYQDGVDLRLIAFRFEEENAGEAGDATDLDPLRRPAA